jgi:hypothetical protein
MTATVLSFRTGHVVAQDHVAVLAEILTRDGCRCAHCRAQGGAVVQYGELNGRSCYIVMETLKAFDSATGQALGAVPADIIRLGTSARIVLDLAYLDHDPGNVGRRGRRGNVVALCPNCARRHDDAALHRLWAQ